MGAIKFNELGRCPAGTKTVEVLAESCDVKLGEICWGDGDYVFVVTSPDVRFDAEQLRDILLKLDRLSVERHRHLGLRFRWS